MADPTVTFDDGAAYERFMGRWSRAAGAIFLDWVTPPKGGRWLDIGCGTGAFTQLVLDTCSPAAVVAVDPSSAQIDYVRKQPAAKRSEFRVADAQALPFPDGAFDVVASALVINFIPDRPRALAEMRRVSRPGGVVATYVWDLAAGRSTAWPLIQGMRQIGVAPPLAPGAAASSIEALKSLFEEAGLEEIATRSIDVTVAFPSFDDFWQSQTPPFSPSGQVISKLPEAQRPELAASVQAILPIRSDGSIAYSARANAIKACVPK
jgi:SAM-dependent methyltransferase